MDNLVLVIDDDAELCEELQEILVAEGFQVRIASSGTAGVKLLKEILPQMVILDLKLPEIGGVEILKQIKKKKIAPPVIVLSGRPLGTTALAVTDAAEDESILKMADAVLNKPVAIETFLEKVRQLNVMR